MAGLIENILNGKSVRASVFKATHLNEWSEAQQCAFELAELDAEDGGVHRLSYTEFADVLDDYGYEATKELYQFYLKTIEQLS